MAEDGIVGSSAGVGEGVKSAFEPLVAVVDFHHARGPEIEHWFGNAPNTDPALENDWSLLPFMALSDGSHASTEDFSYFTLRRIASPSTSTRDEPPPQSSLFGISCTRQLDASTLIERPADVTRSAVQKAVVVVTEWPGDLGQLREKLSVVTAAWFSQRDFRDVDILKKFQESLARAVGDEELKDQYLGLSLREMLHEFKHQTLVLFKCLLLQPKMLFFGSRCERLCMIQFSLISLIPGLIRSLQDCADPAFDSYEKTVVKPTSLKTSERSSLLAYMGLPLQIFGKGSFFGPYTPLQQLDMLADYGTKSYIVGSTNSLLLQQKDRYSDILINLDEDLISITSPSLRHALALSAADRRWIDFLVQSVNETWDEANPSRPSTMGYMGSEEFIRLQFEEYLLALLSSESHHQHLESDPSHHHRRRSQSPSNNNAKAQSPPATQNKNDGDTSYDFNDDFLHAWRPTSNYALFSRLTSDAMLFAIVEPRHPCAGGLSIDDIQRRLAQQVSELHLDERVREGREVLNKHLATGQKKVSTAFNNLWADIEALREAQRRKAEEKEKAALAAAEGPQASTTSTTSPSTSTYTLPWSSFRKSNDLPLSDSTNTTTSNTTTPTTNATPASSALASPLPAVDITAAQASVASAGQKAGAYISSWGAWAAERKKEWNDKRSNANVNANPTITSPTTTDTASATTKANLDDERAASDTNATTRMEMATATSPNTAESMFKKRSSVSRKSLNRLSSVFKRQQQQHGASSGEEGDESTGQKSSEKKAEEPDTTLDVPTASKEEADEKEEKAPSPLSPNPWSAGQS